MSPPPSLIIIIIVIISIVWHLPDIDKGEHIVLSNYKINKNVYCIHKTSKIIYNHNTLFLTVTHYTHTSVQKDCKTGGVGGTKVEKIIINSRFTYMSLRVKMLIKQLWKRSCRQCCLFSFKLQLWLQIMKQNRSVNHIQSINKFMANISKLCNYAAMKTNPKFLGMYILYTRVYPVCLFYL